jgi:hypothetical protein
VARAGGGKGGGGICAELDSLRSTRLLSVGDTACGAADEPEVDGRDRAPCGDRGGTCTLFADNANGDAGERVCGDWGSSRGWLEKMSGERVGGVKTEESSLSRDASEATEERLLDVLGKTSWKASAAEWSEDEELAVDGREREG